MAWQQLFIETKAEHVDGISDWLHEQGALAVTWQELDDEELYEPLPDQILLWKATKVVGLFDQNVDLRDLSAEFGKNFAAEKWRKCYSEVLADAEWEKMWLQDFKPISFANKLWLCPSNMCVEEPDAVIVSLDPGLAFGTGNHPTTALCLEWLAQTDLRGTTVVDYGCGSGVLGIAALKLGAQQVLAIDHDPQALIATQDNARRNQISEQLITAYPENAPQLKAQIVVANILAQVLVEISPQIVEYLAPGGYLVLSGILPQQALEVILAYQNLGCTFVEEREYKGWMLLVCRASN